MSETAAKVAASETLTGNQVIGGNWLLEFTTGVIQSPLGFSGQVLKSYNSRFAHFLGS